MACAGTEGAELAYVLDMFPIVERKDGAQWRMASIRGRIGWGGWVWEAFESLRPLSWMAQAGHPPTHSPRDPARTTVTWR